MPSTLETEEGILQSRVRMAANTALIMALLSFAFGVDTSSPPYDGLTPFYVIALLGLMVASRMGSAAALALVLGVLGVGSVNLILLLSAAPEWPMLVFLLGAVAAAVYGMRGLDSAMVLLGRSGGGRR